MISNATLTVIDEESIAAPIPVPAPRRARALPAPTHFASHGSNMAEDDLSRRQAELFYLQKQIQAQTPMVIILDDGEKIEGCIEWYDRKALKVRGRTKTLVYKDAIKYMYKLGESGQ